MKIMIVEDDFTSRKILQLLLSPYGECDIAINGNEAIDVFREALESEEPYKLVCLDILLPEKDGHEVLKAIRQIEREKGIIGFDGVKVIMTTGLADAQNIRKAFFEGQCEAYLLKPIDKHKLIDNMRSLGFEV